MKIILTDEIHSSEMTVKRYEDNIYIEIPKERNAFLIVKILKIILINLIK